MTPERLQKIRDDAIRRLYDPTSGSPGFIDITVKDLVDYIDLLHEDLRLTRAERDGEKHKVLDLRLIIGGLEVHTDARSTEAPALHCGQAAALETRGPGEPAFHHTGPTPDSRK